MSWMKHTGARYHTQDTGYYCGAASAMVVLAEIGVPYAELDQDDLYTSNHDHNAKPSGWATDPYGLRYTLVDRRPAGFTNTFVVHKPTTESEGTRDIVYTLRTYGVSPAALVFGCAHWVTVPGVQVDVEPVPGSGYVVEGFWLHNSVARDNEPHSATDACGSGGVNGSANEFATYADWQSTYFTGCNYDHPAGHSQFISVCDPDTRKLDLPERTQPERPLDGRRIATRDEAVELSDRGLEEYRLRESEVAARAFRDAQPMKPVLVTRLDRMNDYYYLTPWGNRIGTTAMTRVDARFGFFQGARVVDEPAREQFLDREALLEKLAGTRVRFPDERSTLILFPEVMCVSPSLVWKPCWESWSPNLPFYQVTVGAETFYVRVDGEVFPQLTTKGSGT